VLNLAFWEPPETVQQRKDADPQESNPPFARISQPASGPILTLGSQASDESAHKIKG
jgi:hypothetical protein